MDSKRSYRVWEDVCRQFLVYFLGAYVGAV